jgi:membrane protein insertase Oxa1/YidC/SpoIIIJ
MSIFYCLYLAAFLEAEDDYKKDGLIRTQNDVYRNFLSSNAVVITRFWLLYSIVFTALTFVRVLFGLFDSVAIIMAIIVFAVIARMYINSLVEKALPHGKFDIDYSSLIAFSKKYDEGRFFKLRCMLILYYFIYWGLFFWGMGHLLTLNTSFFFYWPIPALLSMFGFVIMNKTLNSCINCS